MSDLDKTIEQGNKTLQILSGMPFANMISMLQLVMMAGGFLLAVYVLIPEERKVIMESNRQQVESYQKQIDRVVGHHNDSIERLASSFERSLDRVMSRPVASAQSNKE